MEKSVKEMSLNELRDEQSRLELLTVVSDLDAARWDEVCNELYDRADAQEKDVS